MDQDDPGDDDRVASRGFVSLARERVAKSVLDATRYQENVYRCVTPSPGRGRRRLPVERDRERPGRPS